MDLKIKLTVKCFFFSVDVLSLSNFSLRRNFRATETLMYSKPLNYGRKFFAQSLFEAWALEGKCLWYTDVRVV